MSTSKKRGIRYDKNGFLIGWKIIQDIYGNRFVAKLRINASNPVYVSKVYRFVEAHELKSFDGLYDQGDRLGKLRTSYAYVIEFQEARKGREPGSYKPIGNVGFSEHDNMFVYRPERSVFPKKPFNAQKKDACASGIHFYATRYEALAHANVIRWIEL